MTLRSHSDEEDEDGGSFGKRKISGAHSDSRPEQKGQELGLGFLALGFGEDLKSEGRRDLAGEMMT